MKKTKTQGLVCLIVIVVSFCLSAKFFFAGDFTAFIIASLTGWLALVFGFIYFVYGR